MTTRQRTTPSTSRDRQGAGPNHRPSTGDVAYFLTFTTYGSWLPGDERGSVDRHNNDLGAPVITASARKQQYARQRTDQPALQLDTAMRHAVHDAIVNVCVHRDWVLEALHVRTQHVHIVVVADREPERVLTDLKTYATRQLKDRALIVDNQRVWTRHGSTRYLNEDASVAAAVRYVIDEQGAWMVPAPYERNTGRDSGPLPHGRGSLRATHDSGSTQGNLNAERSLDSGLSRT